MRPWTIVALTIMAAVTNAHAQSDRAAQPLLSPAPNLGHFGTRPGSPLGVPGGGITGVTSPPIGGTEMPGSMPAGGQITPLDCDNSSLKLALPVVSPGVDKTKPPVLA